MEVVGALAASGQLLEGAIQIFKRIKKAYDRQQDQAAVWEHYKEELVTIQKQVETVRAVKALQTESVKEILRKIQDLEKRLMEWLEHLKPSDNKAVQGFIEQLQRGNKDRKKLVEILHEFDRKKIDLNMAMNIELLEGNGRIERTVTERMEVNREIGRARRNRTDSFARSEDSAIDLDDNGDNWSPDGLDSAARFMRNHSNGRISRVIIKNNTKEGAMLINAPVVPEGEKDPWKEDNLYIGHNTAGPDSFMMNYPNKAKDLDALDDLQAKREERAARRRRNGGV